MANKISTELLIMILNNVRSQDLHSSSLVNRNWCKVAIPILWELPLGQEWSKSDETLRKKALCIRTYLSCMDIQARTFLTQFGFDLSSSPPQVTFDYPSFTRKLIISNLLYFISIYSPQIISQKIIDSDQDNYNDINNKNESSKLFREICKLIINRCSFLNYFKLASVPINLSRNFDNYYDLFGSILKLPCAQKAFEKLETFASVTLNDEPVTKLISVQKRLENLSINASHHLDCDSLPWAIISQKGTLKSLRLKSMSFNYFKGKPSAIGQFISLQKLYIENCHGLCLSLASSFTQLNSFHYFHSSNLFDMYPQEFVIKILETANTNLKNICLEFYPTITFNTLSAILNYSESVPGSLETIEIRMGSFSADSLRKFFERWCCKGRGGNKKFILKRTELAQLFTLSDEHFKVIEEYGVQFDMEE
ncbi:9830_t:CDS:2 [Diversispora eburnea]|uniref:9830_t:CDS:1 n=1 Tax=Diversispora eburnea TaxID=1213867 RepID=A0A9N9BX98_9GLOM|nr:9830_t:CDS:2 [Diversispora eburnea]